MSGPEGARVCNISEATFRKRLSRARQRIHDALKGHCGVITKDAPCRCHRRLNKAKAMQRAGDHLPDYRIDPMEVTKAVQQMHDLADRVATYYGAMPLDAVPSQLAEQLRTLPEQHTTSMQS